MRSKLCNFGDYFLEQGKLQFDLGMPSYKCDVLSTPYSTNMRNDPIKRDLFDAPLLAAPYVTTSPQRYHHFANGNYILHIACALTPWRLTCKD